MSFITFDYRCPDCGWTDTLMMRRSEVQDTCLCPECGGTANKAPNINITSVSYLDGNKRFESVRERRKLQKLQRQAKKSQDHAEVSRITGEMRQLSDASRRDKKAETPLKKEPPK